MSKFQGKYALVQYCPVPERLEFVNIGLLLVVPDQPYLEIRFAKGQTRIERLFGKQSKAHLDLVKASFRSRLLDQFKLDPHGKHFDEFAARRANEIRLSPLQPILVSNASADFDELFASLVGDQDPIRREPPIRRKLREAFIKHGVESLLDKPDEIDLPEYELSLSVPFGYQNGCYNLIDGMRLPPQPAEGLKEAGKRAIEGSLIWKHFEQGPRKKLVVVGDFSRQSNGFYNAVRDQFSQAHVGLYRLDDMKPLYEDIQLQAKAHGRHVLS